MGQCEKKSLSQNNCWYKLKKQGLLHRPLPVHPHLYPRQKKKGKPPFQGQISHQRKRAIRPKLGSSGHKKGKPEIGKCGLGKEGGFDRIITASRKTPQCALARRVRCTSIQPKSPGEAFFFSAASENRYLPQDETMALKKKSDRGKGRLLCMYRGRMTNLIIKATTGLCCHVE